MDNGLPMRSRFWDCVFVYVPLIDPIVGVDCWHESISLEGEVRKEENLPY
jgi:hypothetical protein